MKLKILGSSSKGNSYLLENEYESLLIECGVHIRDIKRALNFDLSKLKGCLVSHEHQDHCKSAKDLMAAGVTVWATHGTHEAINTDAPHRAGILTVGTTQKIGGFKIIPFHIKHDAAEPCCFFLEHPEMGKTVFLTDTMYCPYTFKDLHNVIVEANYSKEIMKKKLSDKQFLRDRILQSHMSIETCIDFLQANDLSKVNNIVLIHLSDSNSHEADFKMQVEKATGKTVTVADSGMVLNFKKTPF